MKIRGQDILPPKERIKSLSELNIDTGCWEWKKGVNKKDPLRNYGRLMVGSRIDGTRKNMLAHRYSYTVFIGDIPDGMFICHKCDNPKCVNPDHLFSGTRQDNVDDRQRKGRNNPPKAENHAKAILKWSDVNDIRNKYATGNYTQRQLASEYGLKSHKSITDMLKFKTWKTTQPPKDINK